MKYLIGMGSYAMGDDGIGLRIVEHVAEKIENPEFECIEIGNNGMLLLTYFEEAVEKIVIADAAKFGGQPGEHMVFSPEDVDTKKVVGNISTHEGDIMKLIKMAQDLDLPLPAIRIVAVEPEAMKIDTGLSDPLKANFQKYIDTVLEELK